MSLFTGRRRATSVPMSLKERGFVQNCPKLMLKWQGLIGSRSRLIMKSTSSIEGARVNRVLNTRSYVIRPHTFGLHRVRFLRLSCSVMQQRRTQNYLCREQLRFLLLRATNRQRDLWSYLWLTRHECSVLVPLWNGMTFRAVSTTSTGPKISKS